MTTNRAKGVLEIITTGDERLDRLDAKMGKVTNAARWTKWATTITAVASILPEITRGINDIARGTVEMFKLAAAEETNIRSLRSSVESVGVSYDKVNASLERHFAINQDVTRFGDTEQRSTLSELIRLTRDYETATSHLNLALDIQVGAKLGSVEASKLVAFALAGEISAMGRVIPAARELARTHADINGTAEGARIAIKLLQDTFGDAAVDEMGTATQALTSMSNAFGDLKEQLGTLVIDAGAVDLVFGIIASIKGITNASAEGASVFERYVDGILALTGTAPIARDLGLITDKIKENGQAAREAALEEKKLLDLVMKSKAELLAHYKEQESIRLFGPAPVRPELPGSNVAEVDDSIINIAHEWDMVGEAVQRSIEIRGKAAKLEINWNRSATDAQIEAAQVESDTLKSLQTNWGSYFATTIAGSLDVANIHKLTMGQFVSDTLIAIAQTAKVRAVEALGLAFLNMAYGNGAGTAAAFKSAALWGSLAIGAGLVGGTLAESQSGGSESSDRSSGELPDPHIRRITGGGIGSTASAAGGGATFNFYGNTYGDSGLRKLVQKEVIPQVEQSMRLGKLRKAVA